MTAPTIDLAPDVDNIRHGWRVTRPDGTRRTVLKRPNDEVGGWAVFSGDSTDNDRTPRLGYAGSWHQSAEAAIDWARTEAIS